MKNLKREKATGRNPVASQTQKNNMTNCNTLHILRKPGGAR